MKKLASDTSVYKNLSYFLNQKIMKCEVIKKNFTRYEQREISIGFCFKLSLEVWKSHDFFVFGPVLHGASERTLKWPYASLLLSSFVSIKIGSIRPHAHSSHHMGERESPNFGVAPTLYCGNI